MCVSNPGSESGLIFFLWGSRIRICIKKKWILALQSTTLFVLQSEKKQLTIFYLEDLKLDVNIN